MKLANARAIKNISTLGAGDVVIFVRNNDSLVWSLPVWLICKNRGISVRLECCDDDEIPADDDQSHLAPRVLIGEIVVSQLMAVLETMDEQYPSSCIWPVDRELRSHCRDVCYSIVEICSGASPFVLTFPDARRVSVDSTLHSRMESTQQDCGGDLSNAHDVTIAVAMLLLILKISGALEESWRAKLDSIVNNDAARDWFEELEVKNRIKHFEPILK